MNCSGACWYGFGIFSEANMSRFGGNGKGKGDDGKGKGDGGGKKGWSGGGGGRGGFGDFGGGFGGGFGRESYDDRYREDRSANFGDSDNWTGKGKGCEHCGSISFGIFENLC